MKTLFKQVTLAISLSLAAVLPVHAAPNQPVDISELSGLDQIITPTSNIASLWYEINRQGASAEAMLSIGKTGLGYYHEDVNGEVSVGIVSVVSDRVTPLPYDWDVIFFMDESGEDPEVMAINLHNGNSKVYRPGSF